MKSKTVSFYPTDSAKAYKEKLKSRKAEGHEPKKKVKRIIDPDVMDDCGEDLGELNYLQNEEVCWWEMPDNEEMELYQYLKEERPFVLVLAPQCTGTAGWCTVNESIGSEEYPLRLTILHLDYQLQQQRQRQQVLLRHRPHQKKRSIPVLVGRRLDLIYVLDVGEIESARIRHTIASRDSVDIRWYNRWSTIVPRAERVEIGTIPVPDIEYILEQEKKRRTPLHILKPDPQVLPRQQLGKAMMTYNFILKLDPLERLRMQQRRKPFFLQEDQDLRPGQAETRLKIAARTRTRPAAQLGDLRVGDSVDIFRDPPNKDVTGWRGPCKVVAMDRADEGTIDVRWQGRTLPCRPADVRKAVTWWTLIAAPGRGDTKPYQLLVYYVENMAAGTTLLLGYEIGEDGHWRFCDKLMFTSLMLEDRIRCPTSQHRAVRYGRAIRMTWTNDRIDGIAGRHPRTEFSFFRAILDNRSPPDAEYWLDSRVLEAVEVATHLENTERETQALEVEFGSEISRLVIMTSDTHDFPKSEIFSLFANDERHRIILPVNSTGKTKMVIEREADELNKEDLIKHRVEVEKAMSKELGNWIELGALKQRSRQGCTNLMDSRWVIRWKKQPDGKLAVKARLCIKGFKTVQLDLPKDTVKIARQFEPLSNYDVSRHCLEMVRPGFGLKDAPRAVRTGTLGVRVSPWPADALAELDSYDPREDLKVLTICSGIESPLEALRLLGVNPISTGYWDTEARYDAFTIGAIHHLANRTVSGSNPYDRIPRPGLKGFVLENSMGYALFPPATPQGHCATKLWHWV
ncbi:unnamed protein product [Prorocentrum cordatum]|uniref:Uncharacterized protein n=1 Tax=Prorocentrum cordatum TaxID=2364126 RepID=A0ABN9TZZ5_9DINO|nr:unnamed protein product [Polarella glacialis]